MKELSIEEKAKAYDKAIKVAKSKIKNDKDHVLYEDDVTEIFPELKESEDERIIKALYKMAKVPRKEIYEAEGITKEQALAWLEKQGEQKEILCGKCKKTQPSHSCQDITALGRCALEKQGEQKLTNFERAVKQVMEEAIECGDTHNLKADADMLLSLVQKSTWKPSGEQIKALVEALVFVANCESPHLHDYIFGILKNLTGQLKKLRGE